MGPLFSSFLVSGRNLAEIRRESRSIGIVDLKPADSSQRIHRHSRPSISAAQAAWQKRAPRKGKQRENESCGGKKKDTGKHPQLTTHRTPERVGGCHGLSIVGVLIGDRRHAAPIRGGTAARHNRRGRLMDFAVWRVRSITSARIISRDKNANESQAAASCGGCRARSRRDSRARRDRERASGQLKLDIDRVAALCHVVTPRIILMNIKFTP